MMETLTPQRVGPRTGGWSDSGSKKTIFEDSYMQRIKNKRKQKLAEDEEAGAGSTTTTSGIPPRDKSERRGSQLAPASPSEERGEFERKRSGDAAVANTPAGGPSSPGSRPHRRASASMPSIRIDTNTDAMAIQRSASTTPKFARRMSSAVSRTRPSPVDGGDASQSSTPMSIRRTMTRRPSGNGFDDGQSGMTPRKRSSIRRKNSMSGVRIFVDEDRHTSLRSRPSLERKDSASGMGTPLRRASMFTRPPADSNSDSSSNAGTPRDRFGSGEAGGDGRARDTMRMSSLRMTRVSRGNSDDRPTIPGTPACVANFLGSARTFEDFLHDEFDQHLFALSIRKEPQQQISELSDCLMKVKAVSTEKMQETFKSHYSVFLRVINDVQRLHGKVSEIGRQLKQLQMQVVKFRENKSSSSAKRSGGGDPKSPEGDRMGVGDPAGNDARGISAADVERRQDSLPATLSSWLDRFDDMESTDDLRRSRDISSSSAGDNLVGSADVASMNNLEDLLEEFEQNVSEHNYLESAILAKSMQRFIAATCVRSKNMEYWQDIINEFSLAYNMYKNNLILATQEAADDPETLRPLILSLAEIEGQRVAQQVLLQSYSTRILDIIHAISRYKNATAWDESLHTIKLLTNSLVNVIAAGLEQRDALIVKGNTTLSSYAFLWAQNEFTNGIELMKRLVPMTSLSNYANFISVILRRLRWLEDKATISLLGAVSKTLQGMLRMPILHCLRGQRSMLETTVSSTALRENKEAALPARFISSHSKQIQHLLQMSTSTIALLDSKVDEVLLLSSVPTIFVEVIEQRAREYIGVIDVEYATPLPRDGSRDDDNAKDGEAEGPPDDCDANHDAYARACLHDADDVDDGLSTAKSIEDQKEATTAKPAASFSSFIPSMRRAIDSIVAKGEAADDLKAESTGSLDIPMTKALGVLTNQGARTVTLRASGSDCLGLDILYDNFLFIDKILDFCRERMKLQSGASDDIRTSEHEYACSSATYRSGEFENLGKKLRHGFARLWAGTLCEKNTISLNVHVYLVDVIGDAPDGKKLTCIEEQSQWTHEVLHVAMNIRAMVEQVPHGEERLSMLHLRFAVECMRFIASHDLWTEMTTLSREEGSLTFHDLGFMYVIHDVFVVKAVLKHLTERAMRSMGLEQREAQNASHTCTHYEDYDIVTALDYTCAHIINTANSAYLKINETAPDAEVLEKSRINALEYVRANYDFVPEDEDVTQLREEEAVC